MAFTEQEQEIIRYGLQNGKSRQEVEQALTKYRTGVVTSETPEPAHQQGFGEQVAGDVQQRAQKANEAITSSDGSPSSIVRAGTGATAQAFGAIGDVAGRTIQSIPGVRDVMNFTGDVAKKGFNAVVDAISGTKLFQEAAKYPEQTKVLEDYLSAGGSLGEIANNILIAEGTKAGAQGAVDATSALAKKTGQAIENTADQAFKIGSEIKQQVQNSVAGKNVNPQLKESANRLFLEGTHTLEDPIKAYDSFLAQSKRALVDIKSDPAISSVGEQIGDSFNQVVKQRRAVGAVMGDELNKFGSAPTNTQSAFSSFQKELIDNGATYDAVEHSIKVGEASKFAAQDISVLDYYAGQLQKLGANPSARQLDAFISRIPREIKGLKAQAGIQFKTNAERLISSNLNGLRDALGTVGTAEYSAARSAYSQLSSFIEDGAQYLGKITESGDFAKDASLAKSAVQSVLNNGKKDWLVQLEALTGFPALDKAVLALQAMKDAGDFRGLSLLQQLSEGSIPLTQHGILNKIMQYALNKAGNVVAGSPEEQTRAFLRSVAEGTPK